MEKNTLCDIINIKNIKSDTLFIFIRNIIHKV